MRATIPSMKIRETVRAYITGTTEHDSEHSWTHCYRYFQQMRPGAGDLDLHHAALHLGFYLASWGMFRGRTWLRDYTYTIHLEAVRSLAEPRFAPLRRDTFGADGGDSDLVPLVRDAAIAVRESYRPFAPKSESRQASDTLVTKILMGTLGCFPACDRYFISGYRSHGFKFSEVNGALIAKIVHFCRQNAEELREARDQVEAEIGARYPLMKLVDMHFWQLGLQSEGEREKHTRNTPRGTEKGASIS